VKWLAVWATLLGLAACTELPTRAAVPPLPEEALTSPEHFVVVTVRNVPLANASRAGSTVRGYDTAGGYSASASARATVDAIARDYGLHEVSGWPIAVLKVHCVVFRLPPDQTPEGMVKVLARDQRVETAEPLHAYATMGAEYNDPYRPLQRNLDSLSIEDAHRLTTGQGVRVAVIDTGLDVGHPDLQAAGRTIVRRDFVRDAGAGPAADRHGTQVAGLIAAVANNGIGIAGVAPGVSLYAFKACWYPAPDSRAVCNTFTLGQALAAAIDSRVNIVNLSLSGPMDPLLSRLVSQAIERGAVVVGALGPQDAGPSFPTALPGVIAVDAAEDHPTRSDVVLAPGRDILTLAPGGHYDFASGSSLATAEVTGTVALLLSLHPGTPASDIRRLLVESSGPTPAAVGSGASVNACAAIAAAGANCHPGLVVAARQDSEAPSAPRPAVQPVERGGVPAAVGAAASPTGH
jgi:subtilisin family serine protease